ncbi:MAG: ATP-binding cassette domain-containing protein [Bacteroidales bacterium]|nr:ATP-binding cassette domain-containing protein [Bacteroidales bacterium]
MKIVQISGLRKNFGKIEAIRNIDLDIEQGEFFGLLGPNGAGKTTTINVLSTVLKPNAGEVKINGFDLLKNPFNCKQSIGIVPQELALYNELSAKENLLFWGGLYGITGIKARNRAEELLKIFELTDRGNSLIKTFSGGMKRRINIAAAMLHRPEILMMDEPTVGIDPQSRNQIYDVLSDFSKNGVTIIYTTHYMDEVEKICSRIGIIDHGEIIAKGTLEELRRITGSAETIVIHFERKNDQELQKMKNEFGELITVFDDKIIFSTDNVSRDLPMLIEKCAASCISLTHIALEQISLETVFLSLTGRKLRE